MDYCTLTLQTEHKPRQEALLYSKHKRQLLLNSEETHTPVKIRRQTYTDDGQKVIINDMTMLSIPDQKEYSFQFEETSDDIKDPTSVQDILEFGNEWDIVTLRAKAIHVGPTVVVGSKNLKLAHSAFADTAGSIAVDLWEKNIPMVESDGVYCLTAMQIRIWSGVKKLSSTVKSTIKPINDDNLRTISASKDRLQINNYQRT